MEPIEFPQQTNVLAKDQPQYTPLPVHIDENDPYVPMTCCLQLTPAEVQQIVATGQIWLTQSTFGQPFQPIRLSVLNPFQ